MAWQVVAEGRSLPELYALVPDMELTKGTMVKVELDLSAPVAWAFDLPGVEHLFPVPAGMEMVDVYGEGNKGIIELEADPAMLAAVLAFINANWLAIIIAGFVLGVIIAFIRVFVLAPTPELGKGLLILAGIIALAFALKERRKDSG